MYDFDARLGRLASQLLDAQDVNACERYIRKSLALPSTAKEDILPSIPSSETPSYAPFVVLSALLTTSPGQWPILDLQQTYARLWRALPEEAKSGQGSQEAKELLNLVLSQCKQSYNSLLTLLQTTSAVAIIDPQTGRSVSHSQLESIARNFALPTDHLSDSRKPVVAISLPNGPLLAITVLSAATYHTAAPIAYGPGVGAQQFKADVLQSRATVVIALEADFARLGFRDAWLAEAGITVVLAHLTDTMELTLEGLDGNAIPDSDSRRLRTPNAADDTGILLFTSGTSGTKKVVPLSVHSLICGTAMVIESWGLSPAMRCLNQMPLTHVGGIVRNLFAPVMSGGSVICCSAFDAHLFWDCVEDFAPTWYYASPSMHSGILEAANDRPEAVAKSQIRLVCNAAGGLLPSLAHQLKAIFSGGGRECVILPSYGMTECMPISTPPLTYRLEKSGTSGISVGPEIAIVDDEHNVLPSGVSGRITVRGAPVFSGYLKTDNTLDTTCFTRDGRFDTGDLGYLDDDGYLYINGRSKECINRGGELISPFEVEEAVISISQDPRSPLYGRVSKALAFSVRHNVLQEVVGIVITKQADGERPSLGQLQTALKPILSQAKIPVLVVYMDDGVPTNNNKVLRINLADRLSLPEVSDAVSLSKRHYEATCPPSNTPLSQAIACYPLLLHKGDRYSGSSTYSDTEYAPSIMAAASPAESRIARLFAEVLQLPEDRLSGTTDFFDAGGDSMKAGRLLSFIRKEFQIRLAIDSLFANSSVSALAAIVEEKIGSVSAEATLSNASLEHTTTEELMPGCEEACSSTKPLLLLLQLTPLLVFWPMRRALTWTIFMYCLAYSQQLSTNESIPGRLLNLVVSMGVGRLVTRTITPFLAIAFKWTVIGRYREGLYPMWGTYHTRWWFCEKIIATSGMGVLSYFNWSRVLYLRLMGAKIGSNVTVHKGATLGEYDLITIEDDAVLERCKVRPMAPERNTSMYLGRIHIGAKASVGLTAIVAPGTTVPANACIGPNSSSWEIEDADEANRDLASSKIPGAHWALTLSLGLPMQLLAAFVRALPWLACLVALVRNEATTSTTDQVREVIIWFASPNRVGWHYAALAANAILGPFFLFTVVLGIKKAFDIACGKIAPNPNSSRSTLDIFRMQLIRTLMPVPRLHKLTELFGTHYEATSVFLRALGAKVGKHVYWPGTGPSMQDYDLIEVGDNVVFGSRAHIVTSDGTGSKYVRIKDNAMVADRVVLLPGSELGEKTVMGSGGLAKRNRLYPSNTTWVGSKNNGAICLTRPAADKTPEFSPTPSHLSPPPLRSALSSTNSSRTSLRRQVSFDTSSFGGNAEKNIRPDLGSRNASTEPLVSDAQDEKSAGNSEADTTLSPFARAFYHKLAPYRVWTQPEIFLYSSTITILTAVWWNMGSISAVQIVARIYLDQHPTTPLLAHAAPSRPAALYLLFLALIIAIMALQSLLTLLLIIAAKWALLGRRQPGSYDWDQSPYCQRWQLFLKIETLRRDCYGGNGGILGMLTGTHWMVLYFRALGATIGKDCALFAGGQPSLLFTEPDLLTLRDRVAVDDASLVGHINTAGRFSLHRLEVGDRSVLRSGARLLSGASCREETCLLEHTLVMAGEVVEKGVTMQGWPAEEFTGNRMPTMRANKVWGVAGEEV